MDLLEKEIQSFWQWYEADRMQSEIEYPNWSRLLTLTADAILGYEKGTEPDTILSLILTVMGLDHDAEQIRMDCEESLCKPKRDLLIEHGVRHSMQNTRWQIAELLGSGGSESSKWLLVLLDDSDPYVARRALLSLSRVNRQLAEEAAFARIGANDPMIRLVSLRILSEAGSSNLNAAIDQLRNDTNEYILAEIKRIHADS